MSHSAMRLCGSSPAVGSSRNSTEGRCITARATMSRCAMPPERARTGMVARSVSLKRSSMSSASPRARAELMPKNRPWKKRLSRTLSARSSVLVWGTTPIRRLALAGWAHTSMPPT